jgi:hypothetical protein
MIGIAYITTSSNPLGADAGITICDGDTGAEVVRENVDLIHPEDDRRPDTGAADALLKTLGFERFEGWRESGGQWIAEVESV